jgi:hypothetical protein
MAQPFVEPCSIGTITAEPCPHELGREISPQRRRMVLVACVLASSMVFIDGSALTVALPKLRAHFSADIASVQWVLNGYLLALASLTLIAARSLMSMERRACLRSAACCLGWRRQRRTCDHRSVREARGYSHRVCLLAKLEKR